MTNKTITKRLSIALCIILLLFVSLGICFAGNFGTTPVAAAEQTTVANMTAYSSFAENQDGIFFFCRKSKIICYDRRSHRCQYGKQSYD